MHLIDQSQIKPTFVTHAVPLESMAGLTTAATVPRVGDILLAEVLSLGKHTKIENRLGVNTHIFPGDLIIGVYGNRYATDQFEGYVPAGPAEECDLLSIAGVCGEVASKHSNMPEPTRLRVLGDVCDRAGRSLSLPSFGMPAPHDNGRGETILVVGASMNSGKTTTVATLARGLRRAGYRVAAAKITGTAAGKDGRLFLNSGAQPVMDFTDAGYPSTYLLGLDELMAIQRSLVARLRSEGSDYILLEVADGIFQRETRMLLDNPEFRAAVDHVFFAANDSLSAESGTRHLRAWGLPLRAIAGKVTSSPLATREAQEATGLPCLTLKRLESAEVVSLIGPKRLESAEAVPPIAAERLDLVAPIRAVA